MSDGHGGDIYRASRERRCRPAEVLDFSASINPIGPSLKVLRTLRKELWAIRHYPDPESHDLTLLLSKRIGVPLDWIMVGNGSTELIHLLPRGLGIKQALVVGPTFSEYETAVTHAGGMCSHCLADRNDAYRPPIASAMRYLEHTSRFDALFLCNPNSPTGQVVVRGDLVAFLEAMKRAGVWTIIDESFIEFCPDHSVLDLAADHPRLLVLRSFTKFHSIPGLRLGYVVGHPEVLARIRQLQPPWSANALAQAAALAGMKDSSYRRKSLAFMTEERARVQESMREIPRLQPFPSAVNFLLAEVEPPMHAVAVAERLREIGILIRDCSAVRGLNERTIRFAIKTRHENDRLLRSLKAILNA